MSRFFDAVTKKMFLDLAIDLGSTNTLIYRKGSGIVIDEPTVIAFQNDVNGQRQILGVGTRAKELLGRHSGDITVIKPVMHGAVADLTAAREMLISFIARIKQNWFPPSLRVVANVPAKATDGEKIAVRKLIRSAGAREVYLIEEPRALAIGAGLDISEENGTMVIDVGGGITEMAVLVGGKVAAARTIRIGGEHLDQAIAEYMMSMRNLQIDTTMAEIIKIHIGEAYPGKENKSIKVEGINIGTGRTDLVDVTSHEISEVLSTQLRAIISTIKDFLATLSPQHYVDVLDRGVLLAGGGALLPNLDRLFERELSIPFITARDPLACVVRGSGDALDYLKEIRQLEG
jgi:rod shape-determining protein MreB